MSILKWFMPAPMSNHWSIIVGTYEHRQECALTSGDPVHRFALTPQWVEILGYTGRQHCLCSYNFLQWSVHSRWALGCHNGQLCMNEEEKGLGVTKDVLNTFNLKTNWVFPKDPIILSHQDLTKTLDLSSTPKPIGHTLSHPRAHQGVSCVAGEDGSGSVHR